MAGYQQHLDAYRNADVRLVALSADGREGARSMKEEEGLGFPVLYDLDVKEMHERLGLYIQENDRTHLQPAQFILDSSGVIRLCSYSSGPVGRLEGDEALEQVKSLKDA